MDFDSPNAYYDYRNNDSSGYWSLKWYKRDY